MVEAYDLAFSGAVTFDIIDMDQLSDDNLLDEKLTQEEFQEIENIVTEMEGVNSAELVDFVSQETTLQHKPITDRELDRLASKNSALTTQYQMKWAQVVIKGQLQHFL